MGGGGGASVMGKCQWPPEDLTDLFGEDYACGEEAWESSKDGFCIFHAPMKGKGNPNLNGVIRTALESKIAREGNDEKSDFHDFRGYIFPDNFSAFARHEFKKRVDFAHATFGDGARFGHVKFEEDVNFRGSRFGNEVDFHDAIFNSTTFFGGVVFGSEVIFGNATFNKSVVFWKTTFGNQIIFCNATFHDEVVFGNHDTVGNFEGVVNFRGVKFLQPSKVKFEKTNLEKALLSGIEGIEKIVFLNVCWSRPHYWKWLGLAIKASFEALRRRFDERSRSNLERAWFRFWRGRAATRRGACLFDEFEKKRDHGPVAITYRSPVHIARIYRTLQKKFEEERDYFLADSFYAGAMEMDKAGKGWWKGRPYWLYREISRYGQSWGRPLLWSLSVFLLAVLCFAWTGFTPRDAKEKAIPLMEAWQNGETLATLKDSALHAFSVITFQKMHYGESSDSRWFYVATYLETLLVPVFVAFFLLALKRRFRR